MEKSSFLFDVEHYQASFAQVYESTHIIQTGEATLDQLDLRSVCIIATQADGGYGWSLEYAVEISNLYRIFLYLCLKYPHTHLLPPREVDEFWHLHILDTRAYVRDCNALFGKYLHHFPYAGLPGTDHKSEEDLIEITSALVQKHFPEWI